MPFSLTDHLSREEKKRVLEQLLAFVSDNKREKFSRLIASRTRHITVVLEDIFQPHNASAVLRSCDCFGIQDVHIIENNNKFEVNPDVALGASKWLSVHHYNGTSNNTVTCLHSLKKKGYLIAATSPLRDNFTPENLPLDQPIALLFGTELNGLSTEAVALSDLRLHIPMVGFTESLNISVSVAILLFALSSRLRQSHVPWQLSPEEKIAIQLQWAASVIKKPQLIIRDLIGQ